MNNDDEEAFLAVARALSALADALETHKGKSERITASFDRGTTTITVYDERVSLIRVVRPLHRPQ
jgi:hypothetical protein